MNREKFVFHVKHHGLPRTAAVYAFKVIQRLVDLDLMLVETTSGGATAPPEVDQYVTRPINASEYGRGIEWLEGPHEREWAFARGDRCFANFRDSRLVGYQFYANELTEVKAGLTFTFPGNLTYAYASFTHPDHRGRRLARARANCRRITDQSEGIKRQVVWYISIINLASRAVSRRFRPNRTGYVAYIRFGERFHCFASPGCKRAGVSLARDRSRHQSEE